MYDKMGVGLDFQHITKIYYGDDDTGKTTFVYDRSANPILDEMSGKVTITESTDAAPITYKGETMDFKIEFEDEFMEQVADFKGASDKTNQVFIEYEAVVTKEAIIGNDHGTDKTNKNETWLTYGDNNVEVSHDETTTYVYEYDIVKTDDSNKVLTGAKFKLYEYDRKTLVPLVDEGEVGGVRTYHVATQEERTKNGFTPAEIEAGHVRILGLGAGFYSDNTGRKYYLDETQAPDGFNKLANMQGFQITGAAGEKLKATVVNGIYSEGGIKIENNKGSLLPETGGVGTTIFYVVGGILAVGAVVLLVTKRRMNAAA